MKEVKSADIEGFKSIIKSKCKEYLFIFIPLRTRAFRQVCLQLVRSFVGRGTGKTQGFLHLLVVSGALLAVSPVLMGVNSMAVSQTTKQKNLTSSDHKAAYHALSPKNQNAFDSLPSSDQKTVVQTYKNGGDHQKKMTSILNEDQRSKSISGYNDRNMRKNANSPANRSMKYQQKPPRKNESNVFN